MNRSFSLATLNLLIAIAAVCFASTRTALACAWKGDSAEIVVLVIAGALVGTTFGLVLAIWNRPGWIVSLAAIVGGLFLGAAAGAQMCVTVEWPVLFFGPYLLVAAVLVVAANRRRRARARAEIFERAAS